LDESNGLCYVALNGVASYIDAADTRCSQLDAELIKFENDSQIVGLLKLLNNGRNELKTPTELKAFNSFNFLRI
jgi:hypothetical protein